MPINISVDSAEKLEEYIEKVKRYSQMQTDKKFQDFIKDKVWKTMEAVLGSLDPSETTNELEWDIYLNSNHLIDTSDGKGFILYNDAKTPADVSGIQNVADNYPQGQFSLALAFEYGVGIIGMNTNYDGNKYVPWEYNKQGYNFGWYLPKSVWSYYGLPNNQVYAGYEGLEVYRQIADRVEKELSSWVKEYFNEKR